MKPIKLIDKLQIYSYIRMGTFNLPQDLINQFHSILKDLKEKRKF